MSDTAPALDPFDVQIGKNVFRLRIHRQMSLQALADAIGLSYQQVQKYEKGRNRIAGSNLVRIAQVLRVPIIDLFTGIDGVNSPSEPPVSELTSCMERLEEADPKGSKLLVELAHAMLRSGGTRAARRR